MTTGYLGDDGVVLADAEVLLLQAHIVQHRQRHGRAVPTQHGSALAHVGGGEREAAARLRGVVADVAQRRRAAQLLARRAQLPGRGRGGKVARFNKIKARSVRSDSWPSFLKGM